MSNVPRTARGTRTKERILQAAEVVFADLGYHDASIVKITEAAGIGMGTFYLYFGGKQEVFEEVVEDLNHRVRRAMIEASEGAANRLAAERAGFRAFFDFTSEHPTLYRIIRQAEFVAPQAMQRHYDRIVEGYETGLREAYAAGEIGDVDPTVAAWALMGIGEAIGMRWLLWEATDAETPRLPAEVFNHTMQFIERALATGTADQEEK